MKLLHRLSTPRLWLYSLLCGVIAVAIVTKCMFWRRVSQYQQGKSRLENTLRNDSRFRDVRIFFYSTRPSVSIVAPSDLPLQAKQDLERIVSTAFAPLAVPIQYAGAEFFDANGKSEGPTNQMEKPEPFKEH